MGWFDAPTKKWLYLCKPQKWGVKLLAGMGGLTTCSDLGGTRFEDETTQHHTCVYIKTFYIMGNMQGMCPRWNRTWKNFKGPTRNMWEDEWTSRNHSAKYRIPSDAWSSFSLAKLPWHMSGTFVYIYTRLQPYPNECPAQNHWMWLIPRCWIVSRLNMARSSHDLQSHSSNIKESPNKNPDSMYWTYSFAGYSHVGEGFTLATDIHLWISPYIPLQPMNKHPLVISHLIHGHPLRIPVPMKITLPTRKRSIPLNPVSIPSNIWDPRHFPRAESARFFPRRQAFPWRMDPGESSCPETRWFARTSMRNSGLGPDRPLPRRHLWRVKPWRIKAVAYLAWPK